LLQYRNPWLLEHASKMLVSRKMHKVAQLTGQQLSDLLVACRDCSILTRCCWHIWEYGSRSGADLVALELAGVVHAYQLEGYHTHSFCKHLQPGSSSLLMHCRMGEQDQFTDLVVAAHALASMPGVGVGSSRPNDATVAAVLAVAAAAVLVGLSGPRLELC